MKYLIFFIIASYGQRLAEPQIKTKGIYYLKSMYGHVHQNPSPYSNSLTTVSCGHPIKVYASSKKDAYGEKWEHVKVGLFTGYILKRLLAQKQTWCLQDKYPRFFEDIGLSTTDIYYWGRLYDHHISNKTKVQR